MTASISLQPEGVDDANAPVRLLRQAVRAGQPLRDERDRVERHPRIGRNLPISTLFRRLTATLDPQALQTTRLPNIVWIAPDVGKPILSVALDRDNPSCGRYQK
ncbi:hypothetical protein [Mycolicibacterium baixiangningiae]|uniref:hypothetical protein n=1 Tax=Mycolicibacterium baixiangningiae TaxID=2761578 RepID=UPI00186873F4|nr:hypothetical protein [Mycolicibacterium baixiangningiae]